MATSNVTAKNERKANRKTHFDKKIAVEIRNACVAAQLPSLAAQYIRRRMTIDEVRRELLAKVRLHEVDSAIWKRQQAVDRRAAKQASPLQTIAALLNADLENVQWQPFRRQVEYLMPLSGLGEILSYGDQAIGSPGWIENIKKIKSRS